MCKYCEQGQWFVTKDIVTYEQDTAAKIVSCQEGDFEGNTSSPYIVVRGYNDHALCSEYSRKISYCPWCGAKLSDEENL